MTDNVNENQLLKNTFYYTLTSLAILIISFFSIIVFTHVLTVEEFGIVNFFSSTITMLIVILSLALGSTISRFYYDKNLNFSSFIKTVCIFTLGINAIIVPVLLLFSKSIAGFFNIEVLLLYLIIIESIVSIFLGYYSNYLIASQKAKSYMFFRIIPLLANTVLSLILIKVLQFSNNGYLRIIIIIAVNIIYLLYIFNKSKKLLKVKADKSSIKKALLFSMPMIPHLLSSNILIYFSKIVINQYGNMTDTGMYSLSTKIAEVVLLLITSINYAWAPLFYYNNGDYKPLQNILKRYTQIIVFGMLGITFYSSNLVKLLISSNFYEALSIIPVLCLGFFFVFLYQIYINYAIYCKKTINITINTVIAAALNIVLNYIFVPKFGYIAAAYTTLISYIVLFILHYINSKYILKGEVFQIRVIKKELIALAVGLSIFLLTSYISNIIIVVLIRTIYLTIFFIKCDIISVVKRMIFKKGDI